MDASLTPRLPTLIPYLTARNTLESVRFYEKAFGFEWKNAHEQDETGIQHVEMTYRDIYIMFAQEGAFDSPSKTPATLNIPSPMTLYLYCDDVDHLYRQAVAHGAKTLMEPHDAYWGDRVCQISDLDGYYWMFATSVMAS